MYGHRDIMEALAIISAQVHHCERMLKFHLEQAGHNIDPQLLALSEQLKAKTEALQAAINSQAQQPITKEQKDK